ncbi:MAG: hypothetical protein ACLQU3_16295 [Limisphaerales bacterium]
MQRNLLSLTAAFVFTTLGSASASADDLDALAGKWVAERTDAQGRAFKEVLEINKNRFKFQVTSPADDRGIYAEGDVKTETLGPFKTAKFYNIQGGRSPSDLQPVDDDRTVIYTLGYNEMTAAVNFDKERDEPPTATKFTKAAADIKTLVIDRIVMHKTPQSAEYYLCLDATVGETSKRFNIPNKAYQGTEVTIPTGLAVGNARAEQTCQFVLKLDDVAGDEITDEMDNKSTGSFTVSSSGSQTFKPEDGWSYTIYWRLK